MPGVPVVIGMTTDPEYPVEITANDAVVEDDVDVVADADVLTGPSGVGVAVGPVVGTTFVEGEEPPPPPPQAARMEMMPMSAAVFRIIAYPAR